MPGPGQEEAVPGVLLEGTLLPPTPRSGPSGGLKDWALAVRQEPQEAGRRGHNCRRGSGPRWQ